MRNAGAILLSTVLLWVITSVIPVHAQVINPFELVSAEDSLAILDSLPALDSLIVERISDSQDTIKAAEMEETISTINPFELIPGNINSAESQIIDSVHLNEQSIENQSLLDKGNIAVNDVPKEKIPTPPKEKNLFVFWIALISGLLLSIVFNSNRSILAEIAKSLQNLNFMKLLQKEESNGWSTAYIILSIIYALNMAIFARFACIYYEIPFFGYGFISILLFVIMLYLLRHLSLFLISYLRKKLVEVINYSFIIITTNALLGLILVPINLIIAFGPEVLTHKFLIIGLIIIGLAILVKWFRGLINSMRIILSDSFHFLLYLCACEIVPIMIVIGFMRSLIN